MTPSKYHKDLQLLPCPNCNSTNVEESGDDFDADVICHDCTLITPIFRGTINAIYAWNNRKYIDQWFFLDTELHQMDYQI